MASTTQNDARELTSKLWAMANDLRGKMDASEYRDYILGFIFYRYLSKRQERYLANSGLLEFTDTENSSNPQDINNAFARQVALDGLEDWREDLALQNGYAIDPEYTWMTIINKVQTQTIRPDDYQNLFSQFKANALLNTNATEDFKDVFDNINLMDSSLGNSVSARAKALSQLVERIDSIDFHDDSGHDILGDVYEYLIAEFAGASGKKAGEFYTPHEPACWRNSSPTSPPTPARKPKRSSNTQADHSWSTIQRWDPAPYCSPCSMSSNPKPTILTPHACISSVRKSIEPPTTSHA